MDSETRETFAQVAQLLQGISAGQQRNSDLIADLARLQQQHEVANQRCRGDIEAKQQP